MKLNSKSINYNVQTVDELVSLDGLEGDTVVVTDENRGGVFVYREDNVGTNNGGTIFNGWVRQYSGAVNVKWFGAKGDGVTDDTLAIQTTIDFSPFLYCPSGLYVINAPIKNIRKSTITDYYGRAPYRVKPQEIGITMVGDGTENTVFVQGASFIGDAMFLLDGDNDDTSTPTIPTRQFNNKLSGFTIKGTSSALSGLKGIKLKAVHIAKFENIIFTQLQYGVYVDGYEVEGSVDANNSEFLSFEKCEFSENKIAGYHGIQTRQGSVSFTDCDVVRNFGDGIKISVAGLNINGCSISSNGRNGGGFVGLAVTSAVRPSQNRAVNIRGNMFENNNLAHIKLIDVAGYIISGNTHHPYTNYGATELNILYIDNGTFENSGGIFEGDRIEAYGESATAPLTIIKAVNTIVKHKGLYEKGTSTHTSLVFTPTANIGTGFKLSSKTLAPRVLTSVIGSRAVGTTYTNNSIDDLNVKLGGYAIGATQLLQVTIDGKNVGFYGNGWSAVGTHYFMIDIIVPAGKTYRITAAAGTPVIDFWHETI